MALNHELIGASYPPYRYEVSRAKIHEFAASLGETDPRYFSDGEDCVAPTTFAACFTIVQGGDVVIDDPALGAHRDLVHGAQRYAFGGRELRPGDWLVCTPSVEDITTRGSNEFLVIAIDCRFEDTDELAVRCETTLVLLGSAPSTQEAT